MAAALLSPPTVTEYRQELEYGSSLIPELDKSKDNTYVFRIEGDRKTQEYYYLDMYEKVSIPPHYLGRYSKRYYYVIRNVNASNMSAPGISETKKGFILHEFDSIKELRNEYKTLNLEGIEIITHGSRIIVHDKRYTGGYYVFDNNVYKGSFRLINGSI